VATDVADLTHLLAGTPFSFTAHAKDIYRHTVDPERFARFASRARFVVTVCDANKRFIEERLVDERARVKRLYNGIPLDFFDPGRRRPEEPPLFLGVGRLVEKKGFDLLIRAAANLDKRGIDFRVGIVGQGDQEENLRALIEEVVTSKVELLGPQAQEDVHALMMRATAMVLPCREGEDGNRDALPTVLLEALACGLPCVSTPVSGVAEILDDGRAGRLVPVNDPEALENTLADLLEDPATNERHAAAGRTRAEELFDLEKNVAILRGFFERSMAGGE
jgi:glycosyltransferase involved in cell wall biosynthesis